MLTRLQRAVRFVVPFVPGFPRHAARANSFAGHPLMDGAGAYMELRIQVCGEPDPETGYLRSITVLDEAAWGAGIPFLVSAIHAAPARPLASHLPGLHAALAALLDTAPTRVELRPSPLLSVSYEPHMPSAARIAQRFEFSASHRLHVPDRSDEENRRLFGKCNRPSGHGHNYGLEVEVEVPLAGEGRPGAQESLALVVREHVVERFDHRHLNVDCPEFRSRNPSVENIAAVSWELLAGPLAAAGLPLRRVRVTETEKTWAEVTG